MRHRTIALEAADVHVKTRGGIPSADVRRARHTVAELTRLAHAPVLRATVKLSTGPGLAQERRTAEAVLDVQGRLVRARAGAASTRAAIHLLGDRLRTRLLDVTRQGDSRRGRRQRQRPPARLAGERRVVRTLAAARVLPEEAVADMEELDYDFLLFTEAVTGQAGVVYRTGDGYRLARLTPRPDLPAPAGAAISVSAVPAARLTTDEAIERLELTGFPFVFFADASTGAGCLLYRRYDGDHGLVTSVHDTGRQP
ncbi:sigma 54 modulation/S30EA ribosomal C-terminal domain-containing protein [Nonomuraea rhodomycinica]|uniref:Sigma 54 modulation/S30EA ribosomal C-terminal domain-containing protein n=1 Tax=Nonomuraea rhodomycinica TaxID=1712872 RepID=A0A7Y6IJM8_9ACTN|nr:sigma 54 modulation/S30EA ribosomal C-terminal domain-containing protein [Nonomuraea rhodomycinica]NUW39494.1 sigma 54 modulation/S30EA ribosomal C-terminal domain-containing protein [Nonomuraea rhodomycinica]